MDTAPATADPIPLPPPRRRRRRNRKAKGPRLPKLGCHASSGQARCTIGGREHYLGPFGSAESFERYAQLMKQTDNGRKPLVDVPTVATLTYSVDDLLGAYRAWLAETGRYMKTGKATSGRHVVEGALRCVSAFAGGVAVRKLSKQLLVQWRDRIEADNPKMVRGTINQRVRIVRAVLAWGNERGLVPDGVLASCVTLRPLRRGECSDRPDVKRQRRAVSREDIDKVLAQCEPRIAALIELQLATAMRPGEALAMRPCDIDRNRTDGLWHYAVPGGGKTAHHERRVGYLLGSTAQAVLARVPALPTSAERLFPYNPNGYRHRVRMACKAAAVVPFVPHELRHSALTLIAETAGVLAAAAAAGHASTNVTAGYLHHDSDRHRAAAVAALDKASG